MNGLKNVCAAMALLAASACAAPQPTGEAEVRYGRISRIDPVSLDGDHQLGLGSVIGAVAGGVLGYQIGGGTGRDVAMVAGTLGGAFVGNRVENKYADRRAGQHIVVSLDNGVAVSVTQPADPGLKTGDNVRIDGSGQDARVVRR